MPTVLSEIVSSTWCTS